MLLVSYDVNLLHLKLYVLNVYLTFNKVKMSNKIQTAYLLFAPKKYIKVTSFLHLIYYTLTL
jgi:hypothetical protein